MHERPDVLFLVLDSMRIDRVSAYDHDRWTTPVLSRLHEQSTMYENAITPTPWTLPSHSSMFTGQFPSEHGVTNGFSDQMSHLSENTTTLAEHLSNEGYQTAGFSNNPWVGSLSGLNRGFEEFVEWDLEISRTKNDSFHSAREQAYAKGHSILGKAARQPVFLLKRRFFTDSLVDRAKRWMTQTAESDRPTFTFMNLMEAHSPYFPPKRAFRQLGLEPPNPIEPRILNTKLLAYVMGKRNLKSNERQRVMEYYDASLRHLDEKVGELFESLRELDRFDDTLVIVCSDHGKTLGDYDRDECPPHYVRDINMNVPLFIKRPHQSSGETIDEMFELTDLFNVVRDGGGQPGEYTREVAVAEDFVPHAGREAPNDITRWRVGVDPEYKYVRNDTGEEYLFDRSTDEIIPGPDEIVMEQSRETLSERVQDFNGEQSKSRHQSRSQTQEIDDDVQGQLKDLGYL